MLDMIWMAPPSRRVLELQVQKVLADFKKLAENHRDLGCESALLRENKAQVHITPHRSLCVTQRNVAGHAFMHALGLSYCAVSALSALL